MLVIQTLLDAGNQFTHDDGLAFLHSGVVKDYVLGDPPYLAACVAL